MHGTCFQSVERFFTDHPQGTKIHGNSFLKVTNLILTCHDIMQQKENLEKYAAKKYDHNLVTYAFDSLHEISYKYPPSSPIKILEVNIVQLMGSIFIWKMDIHGSESLHSGSLNNKVIGIQLSTKYVHYYFIYI